MPSIQQELESTSTARWYRVAREAKREREWIVRARLFAALSELLAEQRAAHQPGTRRTQSATQITGVLKEAARRVPYAAESAYRRWRVLANQPIPRWAEPSKTVTPGKAFLAEAKIVAFWPYRQGVLQVADAFDMTVAEVTAAYLRALAAWAADDPCLAASAPGGPPGCVPEDMSCLAGRLRSAAGQATPETRAARLTELAGQVVSSVLDDLSITPLGAYNTVREEMLQLLTPPISSITDRLSGTVAEFSDLLMHQGPDQAGLTTGRVRQLLAELTELRGMLSGLSGLGQAVAPDDRESP